MCVCVWGGGVGTKVMIMLVMLEADWAFRMRHSSFGFHYEAHLLILHKM